jgi:Na+/H+-dicarboxylate symporter
MLTAPFGVFALVAAKVGGTADLQGELTRLGGYIGVVVGGLAFHALVVLPVILFVFGRRNPLQYAKGMASALMTAFSTASSAAALPVTMEGVTEENGVDKKTAEFVLPLGATVNMDGTALYEAVAVIFIAQSYGIELDLVSYAIICVTATLAAIGAAAIPEAGLTTMVMVLMAVGIPVDGIGLILAIDWFLDRCRTTVNVWGDAVGCAVVERVGGGEGSA